MVVGERIEKIKRKRREREITDMDTWTSMVIARGGGGGRRWRRI